MSTSGLATTTWIQVRTGWKAIVAWVVALGAMMLATTVSISGLYDTPAKVDSYARALGSGRALEAINGHVYGISTLGGVIANEFGFIASFAVPLMGISLITRATRRDEEAGRLEMLLAGRIGRAAPMLSAMLVTTAALVLTSAALAAGLVVAGVDVADSVVYAAALGALGLVFAGIAAVCAQLVEHARGVYAISLAVLVVAYLLRGSGAVLDNALIWLSPLGWAQEARAFGDARWWPVGLSVGVALLLFVLALGMNVARDLGSAPLRRSSGAPAASAFLRSRLGLAVRLHRGSVVGWSLGAIVISGAFGSLAQPAIEAVAGNEALQQVFGGAEEADTGGFLSMAVMLLAFLCAAYLVQAVGTLRSEETAGRLEVALSGSAHRATWLSVHMAVILAGLVIVAALGALVLGLATAWSTGDAAEIGNLIRAVTSYLPALLVLAAVALALFAAQPRLLALAWVVVAYTAVVTFLADALSVPGWLVDLAPTHHVGFPPQNPSDGSTLAALAAIAVALGIGAFAAFGRRGIPHG